MKLFLLVSSLLIFHLDVEANPILKSCQRVFGTKKLKQVETWGIEFEGFFNKKKVTRGLILKDLLLFLSKNVPRKQLYPMELKGMAIKTVPGLRGTLKERVIEISNKQDIRRFIKEEDHSFDMSGWARISYGKEKKSWVIEDETLPSAGSFLGFEISSPVLRNSQDQKLFQSFIEHIKQKRGVISHLPLNTISKKGMISETSLRSGGLHVHIGKEGFSNQDLAFLYRTLLVIEKQMFEYFQISEGRRNHGQIKHLQDFLDKKKLSRNSKSLVKDLEGIQAPRNYFISTNMELNTLEIRFFEATTNIKLMDYKVEFAKKLTQAILERNPSLDKLVNGKEEFTQKSFVELLTLLDMKVINVGKYK